MNDTGDPTTPSVEGSGAGAGQQESQPVVGEVITPTAVGPGGNAGGDQQASSLEPGFETVQLVSRLLIGVLTMGSGELGNRLQSIYHDIDTNPELLGWEISEEDESLGELLRYLAVGLFVRGQRSAIRGVRRGARLSLGTVGWFLGRANRATGSRWLRPIRRPIDSRLRKLGREADQVVLEGRIEAQKSQALAEESFAELFDEIVELISENPELNRAIREIVAGQGATLASVAGDNARSLSAVGDGLAEGVVRRLLRRTPRGDLPPSSLLGQPQKMYDSETLAEELQKHDT